MKKIDGFQPSISIQRIRNGILSIFVDTPEGCLSRTPRLIYLTDTSTQIEIIVEGFDSFEKNESNDEYITGRVSLLVFEGNSSKSYLLATPKVTLTETNSRIKKQRQSRTANLFSLRKQVSDIWQDCFVYALDSICNNESTNINLQKTQNRTSNNKTNFLDANGFFGNLIKISVCLLFLFLIGFLGLNIYGKAMQVKNIKDTSTSLNPNALAKNQQDVVDETFKQMGIDRAKLTSDLSCFAE